jgi:STE24 endopeptidase
MHSDLVLQLGLMTVLVPPILCGLIYILRSMSPYMPIYLWAFFTALQLVMLTVYPSLIAPLFNTYKPLPDSPLRTSIETLAQKVKFPLKKLFEVDGSKRSGHSNAYMYGFGKNKRIVLYDTLLQQCKSDDQVCHMSLLLV